METDKPFFLNLPRIYLKVIKKIIHPQHETNPCFSFLTSTIKMELYCMLQNKIKEIVFRIYLNIVSSDDHNVFKNGISFNFFCLFAKAREEKNRFQ